MWHSKSQCIKCINGHGKQISLFEIGNKCYSGSVKGVQELFSVVFHTPFSRRITNNIKIQILKFRLLNTSHEIFFLEIWMMLMYIKRVDLWGKMFKKIVWIKCLDFVSNNRWQSNTKYINRYTLVIPIE